MLADPHADVRQVEHLPHRHPCHHRIAQIITAPTTPRRLVREPLVRISHLPQRAALMTRLSTRPPTRPRPQRLRRRLDRPVRRRWPRRVRRVLPGPSPQIRVLRPQHRVLLPQPNVVSLKLNDPGLQTSNPLRQLHDGWRSRLPTMIQPGSHRSSRPADEHLISHGGGAAAYTMICGEPGCLLHALNK